MSAFASGLGSGVGSTRGPGGAVIASVSRGAGTALAASDSSRTAWSEYGSLMALGVVFTPSLVGAPAARLVDADAVDGGDDCAADEGAAGNDATAPGTATGFVSTTAPGARSGDVVTPGA